jgi:hypothetical protein
VTSLTSPISDFFSQQNDRVTRFFFLIFCRNLTRVHSIAEKKITTTKRKEASFFYILAEGDAGNRGIFDCVFCWNLFLGQYFWK